MTPSNVQIMAKPVCGRCNLACSYCYYRTKPQDLYPAHPVPQMPQEVLGNYIRQYMALHSQRADFCWQGGEPLLAGKDFFRKVVACQQQFGRPGQIVGNALQTNGTLVDEAWCKFFNEYQFFLGLSLDGPTRLHDAYRTDPTGLGSFEAAWRGVNLLRKHKVKFNVLVTLHDHNLHQGADLYRFFVRRGLSYLQFIPLLERKADSSPEAFSCPSEGYGRFMLAVFDQWRKDDVGRVSERFLDSVLQTLATGTAGVCWHQPACPPAFVLEWNGDLFACDHFVLPTWRLGNLMDEPLPQLIHAPLFEEFQQAKASVPEACCDCEYLEYCRAGCPKHHLGRHRLDPARTNYFCPSYKLFFRHALPELKKMARLILSAPETQPRGPKRIPGKMDAPCEL